MRITFETEPLDYAKNGLGVKIERWRDTPESVKDVRDWLLQAPLSRRIRVALKNVTPPVEMPITEVYENWEKWELVRMSSLIDAVADKSLLDIPGIGPASFNSICRALIAQNYLEIAVAEEAETIYLSSRHNGSYDMIVDKRRITWEYKRRMWH